tara:strand:- start:174 stop:1568 length:1395 start_codon:yes stop_codon:yes gene_type:complete
MSRKKTPKPANKDSADHRKYWTASSDPNVHYRHTAKGAVKFATRTYLNGVRHYVKLRAGTYKDARIEAMAAQVENEDLAPARGIPTVEQYWLERVIPSIEQGDQRQRTIDGYTGSAEQILHGNRAPKGRKLRNERGKLSKQGDGACPRHILRMRVDRFHEEDCRDWFRNAFLNPYSLSAVKDQWIQWKTFFRLAVRDGYLAKAPDWSIDTKKAQGRENAWRVNVLGQSRSLEVLDRNQLLQVIEDIRRNGQHLDGRAEDVANTNMLLACTGLRMCELRALRWRDVDFEGKIMTLEGRLKSNRKSVDYIHLNPWAIKTLLRMKASGHTRILELDENGKERFYRYFRGTLTEGRNRHGNKIMIKSDPCLLPEDFVSPFNSCDRAFGNACKRLGYAPQSPHKLRHFFATECAEQGDSWSVIAQHLGHSDGGALAAKTYSHVRRGHVAERAAQWDLSPTKDNVVQIAS